MIRTGPVCQSVCTIDTASHLRSVFALADGAALVVLSTGDLWRNDDAPCKTVETHLYTVAGDVCVPCDAMYTSDATVAGHIAILGVSNIVDIAADVDRAIALAGDLALLVEAGRRLLLSPVHFIVAAIVPTVDTCAGNVGEKKWLVWSGLLEDHAGKLTCCG